MSDEDREFEGVRLSRKEDKKIEQLDLFELDDVIYTIPAKVGYNFTVKAMEVAATAGDRTAQLWALQELIGPKAYNALLEFDDLEEEDFEKILEVVDKVALGGSRGKGNRAQRRAQSRRRARD